MGCKCQQKFHDVLMAARFDDVWTAAGIWCRVEGKELDAPYQIKALTTWNLTKSYLH